MKSISLQVPVDFELPTFFHELQPADISRVLNLGMIAFQAITQEGIKSDHEALYLSLKKEACKLYEPQVEQLERKNAETMSTLTMLKQRLQNEESSRLDVERRIREEEKRNREEILKEKELRIKSLEQSVHTVLSSVEQSMKDSSRSLTDGFQNFKEQLLKNSSGSKKKGTQGENVFSEFVKNVFGSVGINEEFVLENVGSEGHQGDLRMFWKNHKVLWEVKNYGRNVDQKEVLKFLRDMEESRDISLGVMVSLTTGITGHQKTGNIDIQELRDGRLCIYINQFLNNEDPMLVLQGIKPFMETFLQYKKPVEKEDPTIAQYQIERFEYQRTILLRLLQNHQESTRKFKNTMVNARKKNDQIWIDLKVGMDESEHQVKLLIETLLDTSVTSTEVPNTAEQLQLQIPSYVFRHTDISLYNEKERKFLELTLKHFKFSEDYSSPAKTVKEIYKELGYSEDAVTAMRPRIFVDDVWEKGKKEVKYIQKIETEPTNN